MQLRSNSLQPANIQRNALYYVPSSMSTVTSAKTLQTWMARFSMIENAVEDFFFLHSFVE